MQTWMFDRLTLCRRHRLGRGIVFAGIAISTICFAAIGFAGDKAKESPGLVIELPVKESEALQIVAEVAAETVIHGTYVYDKDKTLTGAMPAKSSNAFGKWQGPGDVFYKVLTGALAPRNFQDSADIGTITVRYVVQPVNEERTRVRIDAIFIEDGRRKSHLSDGTVETSESKAIQDKVQEIQLAQQKAAEDLKSRQEEAAAQASALRERQDQQEEAARLDAAQSSVSDLEQRLRDLRHKVELRVKESNTPLKSAPFQKAADLQSLGAYADLVVLIVTPYWYGVETTDGHRGWLRRDQVEQLP